MAAKVAAKLVRPIAVKNGATLHTLAVVRGFILEQPDCNPGAIADFQKLLMFLF